MTHSARVAGSGAGARSSGVEHLSARAVLASSSSSSSSCKICSHITMRAAYPQNRHDTRSSHSSDGLPHLAAHTLWPSSPLAHGQHAGGPPEPPVCPCQVAKDTKKAGDKAKKAAKSLAVGESTKKSTKVFFKPKFHRPKTLRLLRNPKYSRRSVPRVNKLFLPAANPAGQ